MNVQTSAANFRRAITIANKVVERRSTIPILSMVRCVANGSFEATGTDLDIVLSATVERQPGEHVEFVMQSPANVVAAVAAAGGKDVSIGYADGKASVSSDALSLSVGTLHADDFPSNDLARDLDPQFSATLSRDHIAAIARVAGAVSTEETRYYLNGVNVKSINPTAMRVAATDGHRLYCVDIELPDAVGTLGENIIIPRKALGILLDLASKNDDGVRFVIGTVAPTNNTDSTAPERGGRPRLSLALTTGGANVAMHAKLIDGTYPDYSRVIPTGGGNQMLFQTAELKRALGAVSGHSKQFRAVKIALTKGGGAVISSAYVDVGISAEVALSCEHRSDGFEVGFNGNYLASIIAASGDGEVLIDMADPAAPALVRNPADTAWTGVLMPMRV